MRLGTCKAGLSPPVTLCCWSFRVDASVVVLFVLCLGVWGFFVLLAPCVCFHIFGWVKVTEWPPVGKIAAHSACDMFHGIST